MSRANSRRVRGYGLSIEQNPSSAFASLRHLLPQGEKEEGSTQSPPGGISGCTISANTGSASQRAACADSAG